MDDNSGDVLFFQTELIGKILLHLNYYQNGTVSIQ